MEPEVKISTLETLPAEIQTHIFSFLGLRDRLRASLTCHTCHDVIMKTPSLWENIKLCFYVPTQGKCIDGVKEKLHFVKRLWIDIDQEWDYNRRSALYILHLIRKNPRMNIQTLKLTFSGENPCFYSGKEFLDALSQLWSQELQEKIDESIYTDTLSMSLVGSKAQLGLHQLVYLDLGQMSISLNDDFINLLSENNPHLQHVNLQTYPVLICRVTPEAMGNFVKNCKKLQKLFIYRVSLDKNVLKVFLEKDRNQLLELGLRYTYQTLDKSIETHCPLGEIWRLISQSMTSLRVSASFHEDCPSSEIMESHLHPAMPIKGITMETTSFIYGIDTVIEHIAGSYSNTLEELVLTTPLIHGKYSLEKVLGDGLKQLVANCKHMKSLVVYSILLDEETINEIFNLCPTLDRTKCLLRHKRWEVDPQLKIMHSDIW